MSGIVVNMSSAESKALRLFNEAARRIPAYGDFLRNHKVEVAKIKTMADFDRLPTMDKTNYIMQYPLADMCWDGNLDGLSYIVSSSGSTGLPFYWPRGEEQDNVSAALYGRVFEENLSFSRSSTLIINAYGQGTWIAGTELYNTARILAKQNPATAIINPGIDIELTITQMQELAQNFAKIIICGYPPLLRDLVEHGLRRGFNWSAYEVYLVTAGEAMSEPWRDYMNTILGASTNQIINVYGLADAGVVASETPVTLALRNKLGGELPASLGGSRTVGLHQYDPHDHYFETDEHNRLLLTTAAGIPLIRYDTKDHGIITPAKTAINTSALPLLSLFGREDLSTTLYAVNIYPENVRPVLDDQQISLLLTGRFVMQTKQRKDMSQYLHIDIELAPNAVVDAQFKRELKQGIVDHLRRTNSEYRELHAKIKSRAIPRLRFAPYNSIGYVSGKKHKWVRRG